MTDQRDIFKAYDVRGRYPEEIHPTAVKHIARSLAVYLQADQLVVGMDARVSGSKLKAAAIEGLIEQGVMVEDVGLVSTDEFYWSCAHLSQPGLMVTASHNPAEYNGCKMVRPDLSVVGQGAGMEELQQIYLDQAWPKPARVGSVKEQPLTDDFIEYLLSLGPFQNIKQEVVVDTGNGASGPAIERLAKKLPKLKLHLLHGKPDGRFLNRGPDPLADGALEPVQAEVKRTGAGLGLALDGDGDRLFVVDERGELTLPDFIACLLIKAMLKLSAGAGVVVEPTLSRAVHDVARNNGGAVYLSKVGHAFIKQRMREKNAVFGCEKTGHYYFRDFSFADSGLLSILHLLLYLSESDSDSLSQVVAPYKSQYFTTLQLAVEISRPAERVLDGLTQIYADADELEWFDGLTISYPDWWATVRPSNTEPKLRLTLEADSVSLLEEKREELIQYLKS